MKRAKYSIFARRLARVRVLLAEKNLLDKYDVKILLQQVHLMSLGKLHVMFDGLP